VSKLTNKLLKKRSSVPQGIEGGLVLSLVSGLFLQGCSSLYVPSAGVGGGVDSGEELSAKVAPITLITGRAINGYLVNGLVFQDANKDGLLSPTENLAITDSSGLFKLPSGSSGDLIVKPINLLADAEKANALPQLRALGISNPDVLSTYYIDNSGVRTLFKGQLEVAESMIGTSVNITPLTTLASGLASSGKMDIASANQKVTEIFGLDPSTDYVALSTSSLNANEGANLQKKAVALSNLLTTTLQIYGDSTNNKNLIQNLSELVVAKLDNLQSNTLTDLDVSGYLGSANDIKSLLLQIGSENDLEVNLSQVTTAVSALTLLNKPYIDTEGLRLVNDTGASNIDHITSDWAFNVPGGVAAKTSFVYGVSTSGLGEKGLPDVWYADASALEVVQGFNAIYIKPLTVSNDNVKVINFIYDSIAPNLTVKTDKTPILIAQDYLIHDDDLTYASGVHLAPEYFISSENDGSKLITEYQLARANSSGIVPLIENTKWVDFLNISSREGINGESMRLYYRQIDLAGNYSEAGSFDFICDNIKPLDLTDDDIILSQNTGIYSNDKYTSSLAVEDIHPRNLSLYDQSTVEVLSQWVKTGDSAHSNNYLLNPSAPVVDGSYSLISFQKDRAGNSSNSLTTHFILDQGVPNNITTNGFLDFNGRSLPLLKYDRSLDTLNEWVQYRMIDTSISSSSPENLAWLNVNQVLKSGEYDMYYRRIDRAGNTSQEIFAGQVVIDRDAPTVSGFPVSIAPAVSEIEIADLLKSKVQVIGSESISPYVSIVTSPLNGAVYLTDYFVTAADQYGNVSDPLSLSIISDNNERARLTVEMGNTAFISSINNQATDFRVQTHSNNIIALGSNLSDKVSDIAVGDIFIGLGGGDLVMVDSAFNFSGISFLNTAEKQSMVQTFGDSLSAGQEDLFFTSPILKGYLENKNNPDAGGIVIFQSQFTSYNSESSIEYISTKWNNHLQQWFLDFGAGDDSFYFGGDAIHVLGGAGSDLLQGGSGNDYIVAGSNTLGTSDVLRGFDGNDTLISGDYYFKSNSNVFMEGGSGNDTLVLGNGQTKAYGGEGRDLFVIAPIDHSNASIDAEIFDFQPGTDYLLFDGLKTEDVSKGIFVDQTNGNVVIDLSSLLGPDQVPYGSTLTLSGLNTSSLLPEDIIGGWLSDSDQSTFQWTDLAIDVLISS
jgi:Ca2+-binding RTX toxin-like protein